jgi:hypothetical protein
MNATLSIRRMPILRSVLPFAITAVVLMAATTLALSAASQREAAKTSKVDVTSTGDAGLPGTFTFYIVDSRRQASELEASLDHHRPPASPSGRTFGVLVTDTLANQAYADWAIREASAELMAAGTDMRIADLRGVRPDPH